MKVSVFLKYPHHVLITFILQSQIINHNIYINSSPWKYHQIENADFMRHSTASISLNVTLFMSFSKTLVAN